MLICRFKKRFTDEPFTMTFTNDVCAANWCSAHPEWYCVAVDHR